MYNDVLQKYQEVLEQAIASEMILFQNVQLKQLPAGHEGTIQFEIPDNTENHFVSAAPWGLSKEFNSLYPLSNIKEYFKMMMEGAFNGVVLQVMDPETETQYGQRINHEDLNPHIVHYADGLVEDMFRLQDEIHKSYPDITADQVFVPELRPDEHKGAESPLYDLTWRVEKKALEKAGFRIQQENHEVRFINSFLHLFKHGLLDFIFTTRQIAACVHQGKIFPGPLCLRIFAVASHSGLIVDNGIATANNSIKQSGFADIRSSDYRNYWT